MRKNSKNRDESRRELARTFRKEMGVSERVFWELVRKERLGFAFRRQIPIDAYVLDFYCAEASLCVEIDGEQHELRRDRDKLRDLRLRELGIETIRIPSHLLFDVGSQEQQRAIDELIAFLERRSGRKAIESRNLDTRKRRRCYKL